MNTYAKSSDSYLAQRILGTSPEQQAALLMEAGQRYLGKAILAMEHKAPAEACRCLIRVSEIITEAFCRLDHDGGGPLVENLIKTYDWWNKEIMAASNARDTARLGIVSNQMGDIRQAWEQCHEKKAHAAQSTEFLLEDRVV